MLLHHFKISWRNLLKYKVQNAISIACLAVGVVCFAITVYFMYGFGRHVYYSQIKQDIATFSVLAAPYEETERLRKTGSFPENAQLDNDFFKSLLSLKLPAMEGLHGYHPLMGVDQTFYDNTDQPKTCNCYYTHSSPRYWMYYGYRSAITGEPLTELEENDCLITDDLSAQLFGEGTDPRGFEYAMMDGTEKHPIRDVIKVTDRLDALVTNTVVIIRNDPRTAITVVHVYNPDSGIKNDLPWLILYLILAILIVVAVTLITISHKIWKVSKIQPAEVVKKE